MPGPDEREHAAARVVAGGVVGIVDQLGLGGLRKLSIGALSKGSPLPLMEARAPITLSAARCASAAYRTPQSECAIRLGPGRCCAMAVCNAASVSSPRMWSAMAPQDLAAEKVEHHGAVQPPLAGADACQVCQPHAVRGPSWNVPLRLHTLQLAMQAAALHLVSGDRGHCGCTTTDSGGSGTRRLRLRWPQLAAPSPQDRLLHAESPATWDNGRPPLSSSATVSALNSPVQFRLILPAIGTARSSRA